MSDYSSFDDEPTEQTLLPIVDPIAESRQGGLKTYHVQGDGSLWYDSRHKSKYHVMVERLLSVDGWETPIDSNAPKSYMSLIILKLTVNCTAIEQRVQSVETILELESQKNAVEKSDPDVVAWAPFHSLTLNNPTTAQIQKSENLEVTGGVEKEGVKVSTTWNKGHQIAFERTYFERAWANPVPGAEGKRRGVSWYMEQNQLQNNGVMPVVHVAVLFKRASPNAPYVVKFRIEVKGGSKKDWADKALKTLGLGPGVTKPFLVYPSENPRIRYEGKQFLPHITQDYLGNLMAKDTLGSLVIGANASDEGFGSTIKAKQATDMDAQTEEVTVVQRQPPVFVGLEVEPMGDSTAGVVEVTAPPAASQTSNRADTRDALLYPDTTQHAGVHEASEESAGLFKKLVSEHLLLLGILGGLSIMLAFQALWAGLMG